MSSIATDITRPRLMERVLLPQLSRITLISAPPGYGKSTLMTHLSTHLKAQGFSVRSKVLIENDNDFDLFRDDFRGIHDALSNGQKTAIFLDDFHVLTNPIALDHFKSILNDWPETAFFLLGSREIPEIGLARRRMLGQVCEITAEDLRFTTQETQAVHAAIGSSDLTQEQSARIAQQTDGWGAAIRLACHGIVRAVDADQYISSFSGRDRNLVDFLLEDVFGKEQQNIQRFLLATCVVPRFTADLCHHLSDDQTSAQILSDLERRNLFLRPLDTDRTWFAYHQLFRDFLIGQLGSSADLQEKNLLVRAAHWLCQKAEKSDEKTLFIEAAQLAQSAGDEPLAAQILDQGSDDLFRAGHMSLLMTVSDQLPSDLLMEFPRLQLTRVWALGIGLKHRRAKGLLEQVQHALEKKAPEDPAGYEELRRLAMHRQMIVAAQFDKVDAAESYHSQVSSTEALGDSYVQATIGNCSTYIERERYRAAQTDFRDDFSGQMYGTSYGKIWRACLTGPSLFCLGKLTEARDMFAEAVARAKDIDGDCSPLGAMPAFLQAYVDWELGNTRAAKELVADYEGFIGELGLVDELIAAYLTTARIALSDGQHRQALEILERGCELAQWRDLERLEAALINERIRILLEAGKHAQAEALFKSVGTRWSEPTSPPSKSISTLDEWRILVWARLALMSGEASAAIGWLSPWLRFLQERKYVASIMRIAPLLCQAHIQNDDQPQANRVLSLMLDEGSRGPFMGVWQRASAGILTLLQSRAPRVDQSREHNDYVAAVMNGFAGMAGQRALSTSLDEGGLAPQLTAREIETLRYVGMGWTNGDIASELGISIATVKYHLQQIYQKLNVSRRSDAVNKVRAMGILTP